MLSIYTLPLVIFRRTKIQRWPVWVKNGSKTQVLAGNSTQKLWQEERAMVILLALLSLFADTTGQHVVRIYN